MARWHLIATLVLTLSSSASTLHIIHPPSLPRRHFNTPTYCAGIQQFNITANITIIPPTINGVVLCDDEELNRLEENGYQLDGNIIFIPSRNHRRCQPEAVMYALEQRGVRGFVEISTNVAGTRTYQRVSKLIVKRDEDDA